MKSDVSTVSSDSEVAPLVTNANNSDEDSEMQAADDAVPIADSSLEVQASNSSDAKSGFNTLEEHATANPIAMLMLIFAVLAICPLKRK